MNTTHPLPVVRPARARSDRAAPSAGAPRLALPALAMLFALPVAPARALTPEPTVPEPVVFDPVATGPLATRPADLGVLTAEELALWRDPDFKRRFVESYVAETEIEPRVTERERKTMLEILELISSERPDEALEELEDHRGEVSSAVFDFTMANIHFQREDHDRAAEAYRVAVRKHPKFRRAWKNLGLIHVRRNEFEEARRCLAEVIALGGGDAITYGLLGMSCSNTGDELAAESAFRMANLLDPGTFDWKMGMARSFFKQRRYADAAALCEGMIAEFPDRADLWLLQANAYIGLDKPLEAAGNYELVDRLGGSTVASLNMLGDIYINESLYDLAVDSYVRAMELDPDAGPDRAIRAAKVLTARAAMSETRTILERIEAMHGARLGTDERKDLLKLRARLAVAEGAGEEEIAVLEEIVELDPLDGEALILLGQHANRSGDLETAEFYYERAAAVEAFEADASVRHAQLLVGQGRYVEALSLLRRAQTLKPRDNIQDYLEAVERVAQSRS